jgi:PAS domain S-box-containing protein
MLYINAYTLGFFELTFILVAILLLHSAKRLIGNSSFYLALGSLMVLAQILTAVDLQLIVGTTPETATPVNLGPIFFIPFMAALLITYTVDGTTEAQRMIIGFTLIVGMFVYISYLAERQFFLEGYEISPLFPKLFMHKLFHASRIYMVIGLLSVVIEFFIIPVIYQFLRNCNLHLTICVMGALIFTQVLDSFSFELLSRPDEPWLALLQSESWWRELGNTYLFRAVAALWVGTLTYLYMYLREIPVKTRAKRDPLDILWAFVGRTGQTRRLQSNLREWEGRYQMVVESANDMIFMIAKSGIILDANRTATQKLGYSMEVFHTLAIQSIMRTAEAESYNWAEIWDYVFADHSESDTARNMVFNELRLSTQTGNELVLDATISPLIIQGSETALIVARDITRRRELESEREVLRDHLVHAQRMEAVGKLAGGIAHDFNNLLHAIQGSLDLLDKKVGNEPESKQLVTNISTATTRAAHLTGQLLGFARGGKYEVKRINMNELVRTSEELFRPMLGKKGDMKVVVHPDPMIVEGDRTQVEQVILNLLINAADAFEGKQGRIVMRSEPANAHTPGWAKVARGRPPEEFMTVRVKDNGIGMAPGTLDHIFDPFFTTKQDKGTGMGLAMVYGCIENHHGWIHVDSKTDKGTEFFIFLPRVK